MPVLLGLLLLFLATQYPYALSQPFLNDDYVLLDHTRDLSLRALWQRHDLLFGWYRPWSREFHYWGLQNCFGTAELPFHATNVVLWVAVITMYFVWVRRLAGRSLAAISTAGLVSLALWAMPISWVAGAQDLWALTFSMLYLHAISRGSTPGAIVALAFALLSKESTAVLPLIALAHESIIARRGALRVVATLLPSALVVAIWAAVHPTLLARVASGGPGGAVGVTLLETGPALIRTVLAQMNLEPWPAPSGSLLAICVKGASGALILAVLITVLGKEGHRAAPAVSKRRILVFGLAWAAAGWIPLLLPSLGWHAYYGVIGSLGVWLSAGALIAGSRGAAIAMVVTLALLRSAQASTRSHDWGTEWYQHRAGNLLRAIRSELRRELPSPPPNSRMYFARLPDRIGMLTGDGPSIRVWYGDPTLTGRYYVDYRPRAAHEVKGRDYFFVFDSTSGLREVATDSEDPLAATTRDRRWESDHDELAGLLVWAQDPGAAIEQYRRIARLPGRWDADALAGACFDAIGAPQSAESCYRRVSQVIGYPVRQVRDSTRMIFEQLERHRPRD